MKTKNTSVKKKTSRKMRKAKHQPAKPQSMQDLNSECKKVLKGDDLLNTFHVFIGSMVSLGNTIDFITESMLKLKFTDDQKASLKQKIINVRGRWTSEEKKTIVAAASEATSKTQSEDSLGISKSRKSNTVQRSALLAGQELLAWCIIKWHRVTNDLATGDQFAKLPAMTKSTTLDAVIKKAFAHCYQYGGKEHTLRTEVKALYNSPDYSDPKAASKAISASLLFARATDMMTRGDKMVAKAYRKFKSDLQDDYTAKRKRATLVKSGKKHLTAIVKTYKLKGHKPVNTLKAIADNADDIATVSASGGETNRIKQLTELAPDKVLVDIAKGRSKSVAIRKALATL